MKTETRAALKARSENVEMPESVVTLLCRATAKQRHASRVAATLAAVEARGKALAFQEGQWPPCFKQRLLIQEFLVLLDIQGVGGTLGLQGDGTARAEWATALGSGRRGANDGPAYMAALRAALATLREARREIVGPEQWPLAPLALIQDEVGGLSVEAEGFPFGVTIPFSSLSKIEKRELQALAGRTLLADAGIEEIPWLGRGLEPYQKGPLTCDPLQGGIKILLSARTYEACAVDPPSSSSEEEELEEELDPVGPPSSEEEEEEEDLFLQVG